MGQLAFFIQCLKTGYRFGPWVEDCPLIYTSPNTPKKVNVLGSLLLSILSGHKRYAHIGTLTGDGVNSKLLGMTKVVSDDSARRGLLKIDEQKGVEWMQNHLQECYELLLKLPCKAAMDFRCRCFDKSNCSKNVGKKTFFQTLPPDFTGLWPTSLKICLRILSSYKITISPQTVSIID